MVPHCDNKTPTKTDIRQTKQDQKRSIRKLKHALATEKKEKLDKIKSEKINRSCDLTNFEA